MEKGRLWDLADLGEMANFQREARSPPLASAGEHACARVHMNALLVNRIWCHPQFQAYCQCLGRQPPPLSEGDGYNWIAPTCGGSVSSKVTEGDLADCSVSPGAGGGHSRVGESPVAHSTLVKIQDPGKSGAANTSSP